MSRNKEQDTVLAIAADVEAKLMKEYGPMLSGDALRLVLGYPSKGAMRQAILRGVFPVPVFTIENRRGKLAMVSDVAYWLAKQRSQVDITHREEGGVKAEKE